MNIKIGEYQINSDSMQFIVSKITTIQESRFTKAENVGKETTKIIAYCNKIDEAIRFIPNDILKTNSDISIIIDKLNEIQADIQALEYKPVVVVNEKKEKEDIEIVKLIQQRYKNDNGERYSIEEVLKMRKEILKQEKGESENE